MRKIKNLVVLVLFIIISLTGCSDDKNDLVINDVSHDSDRILVEKDNIDEKMEKLINSYKNRSNYGSIDNASYEDGVISPSSNGIELIKNNLDQVPKKMKEMYPNDAECMWNDPDRVKSRNDPLQSKFNIVTTKSLLTLEQWNSYADKRLQNGSITANQHSGIKRIIGGCFEATNMVEHPINPDFCIGVGAHESAWGTSNIYKKKGNAFGWKAYNDSPLNSASKFGSDAEGAKAFMEGIWGNKLSKTGKYHHEELGQTMLQVSLSYAYNNKGSGYCNGGKPSTTWSNSAANFIKTACKTMDIKYPNLGIE